MRQRAAVQVDLEALLAGKHEHAGLAGGHIAGVLIAENPGSHGIRVFEFPQELTVVGVVGHQRFVALHHKPAVECQRAHGAVVTIDHHRRARIAEPQHAQPTANPLFLAGRGVAGVAVLVIDSPAPGSAPWVSRATSCRS